MYQKRKLWHDEAQCKKNEVSDKKTWVDICKDSVVHTTSVLHVAPHVTNVEKLDAQELQEQHKHTKNIFICSQGRGWGNTSVPCNSHWRFFLYPFDIFDIQAYGACKFGKPQAKHSKERAVVCTMTNEVKRKIACNSWWVYLKGPVTSYEKIITLCTKML